MLGPVASTSQTQTPDTFLIGRWLFLRVFGVACLFAFLGLAHQIVAIVGDGGLVPAADSLAQQSAAAGSWAWLRAPSVFWLSTDDMVLQGAAWLGVGFAALFTINVIPRLALAGLWLIFLSVASLQRPGLGGVLFDFAPDHLLLEGGLFALFLVPGGVRPGLGKATRVSRWARFLLVVLLFKMMFGSGIAKAVNGQDVWWDLTALYFDYETRPAPTPLAPMFREMPMWILVGSALFMFVAELVMPWLYFCKARLRLIAAVVTIALMIGIMLTGNYRWFPLATLSIALLVIDDAAWRRMLRLIWIRVPDLAEPPRASAPLCTGLAAIATTFVVVVGACQTLDSAVPGQERLRLLGSLRAWIKPYHVSHGFDLFGLVRRELPVIVFQGSDDGVHWREFDNRLNPGALDRPCRFAAPYHYYLDFLMWLSSELRWDANRGWLEQLMHGLLSGNPATYGLFRYAPFTPEHPPKYVRGVRYTYRYTDASTRATGQWWTREPLGPWSPTTTLHDGRVGLAVLPPARKPAASPRRSSSPGNSGEGR